MAAYANVRRPAVAGQFYPDNPEQLRAQLDRYLTAGSTSVSLPLPPQGLIVPHAGYSFSGSTAGKAYALLEKADNIQQVMVMSPSHRVPFQGASVGDFDTFRTPLGEMPVATDTCAQLREATNLINGEREPHLYEHALEVQLPFIQRMLPEASLIPLMCGDLRTEQIHTVADALQPLLEDEQTLLVASSDFTHYGRSFGYVPFTENVADRIKELDMGAVERITSLDPEGFLSYVHETGATICGQMPISLLLALLENDKSTTRAELVDYSTSGEFTGDYSHCVSYAAIAFNRHAAEASTENTADEQSVNLRNEDKKYLLGLARDTIEAHIEHKDPTTPDPAELPDRLKEECATFVTLRQNNQLRGCIGSLEATEPLYRNVISNAVNSAFHDPRFPPLTRSDLAHLQIEISVLTPSRAISGPEKFHPGRHGIILKKNGHRAVFLPQVASEQGWDRETTLNHLALKAGLPQDAWRHGNAEFEVFEAIVFSEEEFSQS